MRTFVCRVEAVFEIRGRGWVIAPGAPTDSPFRLTMGSALVLVHPDGTEVPVVLRGIEMGGRTPRSATPLLLAPRGEHGPLTAEQVPIGVEVWAE